VNAPHGGPAPIRSVEAFTALEAAAIIWTAAASTAWRPAGINADLEVKPAVRDAEILEPEADQELFERARERLVATTAAIAAELAPKSVLAELQIVRYHAGGKYVDHRDTLAPGAPRALSLVCYLNDDFAGGATVFAEPRFVVEPHAGTAIVFSPLLLHRADPVTSGTKYVVTAWYHSLAHYGVIV
jgi:predicted 2-oxoglutarate/Fe(II)-dependent dioxygenase YbiX